MWRVWNVTKSQISLHFPPPTLIDEIDWKGAQYTSQKRLKQLTKTKPEVEYT